MRQSKDSPPPNESAATPATVGAAPTDSSVSILIREPDDDTIRYVEVDRLPFTIGDSTNADIPVHSPRGPVRVRISRVSTDSASGVEYRAQNLVGAKPGGPVRMANLIDGMRMKTAGVIVQFFSSPIPDDELEDRVDEFELATSSTRSSVIETQRAPAPVEPEPAEMPSALDDIDPDEVVYVIVDEDCLEPDEPRREPTPRREPPTKPVDAANASPKRSGEGASTTNELLSQAEHLLGRLDRLNLKIDSLTDLVPDRHDSLAS